MRFRSPQKVLAEIQRNIEKYNARRVGIRDDMHFVNMAQTKEIVQGIIEKKLNITWFTSVRADYFRPGFLDDQFLPILIRSGLDKLSLGAESGSQRILDLLEKDITPQQVIYAVQQMKKYCIVPVAAFLSCIPGETFADFMATMRLIKQLEEIHPQIQINGPAVLRPYPGGKLYDLCIKEYGYRHPTTFREWGRHDYASEDRLPWVKNMNFYKYLWISLLYARKIKNEEIVKECGSNYAKRFLRLFLKKIWFWRYRHMNYRFTVDYKLYELYYKFAHGTNPDLS